MTNIPSQIGRIHVADFLEVLLQFGVILVEAVLAILVILQESLPLGLKLNLKVVVCLIQLEVEVIVLDFGIDHLDLVTDVLQDGAIHWRFRRHKTINTFRLILPHGFGKGRQI